MNPLDIFSTTSERDIDLLLLEEFCCHIDFLGWFYGRVRAALESGPPEISKIECSAKHSVGTSGIGGGETDLWVLIAGETSSGDPHSVLLLIENKVSASFTPDQPERYGQRAEAERRHADADTALTVLIAPAGYLATCGSDAFDACLPYEDIKEFLEHTASQAEHDGLRRRLEQRALMLDHAILGYRRSGGRGVIYSETHTRFFDQCYELIENEFSTSLTPFPNKRRGRGSDGVNFSFQGCDRLKKAADKDGNKELRVNLEFSMGLARVRFHHWPSYIPLLPHRFATSLPEGWKVQTAANGKTFDVIVPGLPIVDATASFDSQVDHLRASLSHTVTLKKWMECKVPDVESWIRETHESLSR